MLSLQQSLPQFQGEKEENAEVYVGKTVATKTFALGKYDRLLREFRQHEQDEYKKVLRMTPETFDELLALSPKYKVLFSPNKDNLMSDGCSQDPLVLPLLPINR